MSSTFLKETTLMNTYNRFPLTFAYGKGSYLTDEKDVRYLDFTSGIATCNLGHVPDYVKEAVTNQLNDLWHCTNLFHIPAQEKLANLLTENSCFDKAFFCNSGAEANEAAIKLARRYAQKVKENNKYEIVTFTQSFHGRTLATVTATAQPKLQDGFAPLPDGFRYLPYNDIPALEELVSSKTCAVMLELVQGEGGVNPADQEWIEKIVKICHENNLLLIVDEVQTGIGRTGTLFAYEQYGIKPDIMTLAKGLGSGFPIGAMVANSEVAKGFEPGSHGSTFGGNPLATTAGFATLEFILNHDVIENVGEQSEYLRSKLQGLQKKFPMIKDIRGKGLLIGLEINGDASQIVKEVQKEQVLILTAGPQVVRILPPLTVTKDEIDQFLAAIEVGLEKTS